MTFQFTHPGGVRQYPMCLYVARPAFQFTHPGGVRRERTYRNDSTPLVSIHAPGRGATVLGELHRWGSVFQFTHPGGVRHKLLTTKDTRQWFQFTHPGGVRRVRRGWYGYVRHVSIHAPGRGATSLYTSSMPRNLFQFTHPGGVRHPGGGGGCNWSGRFNSRTREGCDLSCTYERVRCSVSIHAPGRGATP